MKKINQIIVITLLLCFVVFLPSCKKKELTGYDVELAREVGKQLGVEVKFQEIIWTQKEFELESYAIDLIWNELTITEERLESMTISTPYLMNKQVIVVRSENKDKYKDVSSLKDAEIAFESGSAADDFVSNSDELANAKLNRVEDMVSVLTELMSGTSEVGIMDSIMAQYYLSKNSNYQQNLVLVTDEKLGSETIGIAMRKGEDALCEKINEALSTLYKNKTMESLAKKYSLETTILDCTYSPNKTISANDNSWKRIQEKKTLVIGYTLFAPMAYYPNSKDAL
jgi:polar amino acid transport system substrate-binding protein